MTGRELATKTEPSEPLTASAHLDRLLGLMARWWEGWSLARIAAEYRLSRQRVAALLAQVGCTRATWCQADHGRPDSPRRAMATHVAQARAALLHPLAHRLTIRQRAALAWQAQGLVLTDIARRMRTTPQNVRHCQVAARWRLDRLSRPKPRKRAPGSRPQQPSDTVSSDGDERLLVDWPALISELTDVSRSGPGQTASPEWQDSAHAAPCGAAWTCPSACGRPRHPQRPPGRLT